jgi:hypothetical protein
MVLIPIVKFIHGLDSRHLRTRPDCPIPSVTASAERQLCTRGSVGREALDDERDAVARDAEQEIAVFARSLDDLEEARLDLQPFGTFDLANPLHAKP